MAESKTVLIVVALIGAAATIGAAAITTGGGGDGDEPSTSPPPPPAVVSVPKVPEIPEEDAAIFLSRDSGPGGTEVRVSGEGFAARERVVISFHTEQIGTTRAGSNGKFANVTVTIPTSFSQFAPQQFSVRANGKQSIRAADAPFTLSG